MIICLTGPMASGKNYIASRLENEEAVSIDLDKTVHKAIELCTPEILKTFEAEASRKGITLTDSNGNLNRRALGALVFSDSELLKKQEAIVYPKVIELTLSFIEENSSKTVILNATVLYKTPQLMNLCNAVYFVQAGFFKRLYRAIKRDKMPLLQILKRFKAQSSLLDNYKATGKPVFIIKN